MKRKLMPLSLILFFVIIFFSAKPDKARFISLSNNLPIITSSAKDDLVCTDCHSYLVEETIKHAAAIDNGCITCHQSNGREHPSDSTGFTLSEKVPELCYMCHDIFGSDIAKMHSVHGTINQKKSCLNCHSPHSSNNRKLLLLEEKELCLSCHNKTITVGMRKLPNIDHLIKNSEVIHPAIEGGCIVCHKPHASENKFLLVNKFPDDIYTIAAVDTFSLCFDCHDSRLLIEKLTISTTNFRNDSLNLHYLHINGNKARSCVMCHDMHASNDEHLILDEFLFGNWKMKLNYVSLENGGSCLPGCHAEKTYTR